MEVNIIKNDVKKREEVVADKEIASDIDTSGLNKAVQDVLEDLEIEHDVYGDETVRKATLKSLKHLQEKRELSHKELKMNIYLDFLDDPAGLKSKKDYEELPLEDLWEMGKTGLDHLEKNTDIVESSSDREGSRYRWNPERGKIFSAEMNNSEKSDQESDSLSDLHREKVVESGKQFLKTVYRDGEEAKGERKEISILERGKSYLIKEKKPEKGLELSIKTMEVEGKGYILTSINPEDIKSRYDVSHESISYHWLTVLEGENKFSPSNLHLIGHSMIDFLEEKKGPVFMDGVEIILKHNSFDRFWGFLNHLVDVVSEENGILVLSLDPRTLSDIQSAKIERKLELL